MLIHGYKIQEKIHESSQSLVYRAIREHDQLPVILKNLKQSHPDPITISQFKQEYKILDHLNLPGVIKTYGLEKYQNSLSIILEDFGGESLSIILQKKTLTLVDFLRVALGIVESLSGVHAANVIHKDINPSNIILQPETHQIKLIDFGISTRLSTEDTSLCDPNLIEGTLAYMSPEQTGRMNRKIDYHTDFYSLGVTFYEMLTGQLPFVTNDPLELVHFHLAKQPIFPSQINHEIPPIISKIVMKLLAKTSEERYQSAGGIKADLEICLKQIQQNNSIQEFTLGKQDISEKFQIPQKLYGREKEIERLVNTFENVIQGQSKMMLVSGYSGIGKSALIREIYPSITQRKGYFIAGKFEQFQRNIPYGAIIQACQELVSQLLTESEQKVIQWRQQILDALGVNGQVIIDVIPEIERIIGTQPEVIKLEPSQAQNRFNLVFQNFLKVFTKQQHPLGIFLDDLQWADSASLQLIKSLMTTIGHQHLLVIGAYRDNEVDATHPLRLTLDEIKSRGTIIEQIYLKSLNLDQINQLISETVRLDKKSNSEDLAKLVEKKTNGNPFFVKEFLTSLYRKQILKFERSNQKWHWNKNKIETSEITDNVVELMANNIKNTQIKTQEILKLAACIGSKFDLKTLAMICNKSQIQTANYLLEALETGLIIPINNQYKLIDSYQNDQKIVSNLKIIYKFSHDRVQQAAYSLISPENQQEIHLKIGKILLENTPIEKQEERIFTLVNQLNLGKKLIHNQSECYQLANLNLIAGKKAKLSAAYQPAFNYLQIGIDLLTDQENWIKKYQLILELHLEAAESAYLYNNFEAMEQLINTIVKNAQSILDKVKAYEIKIKAHTSQNQLLEAIDLSLATLSLLGIKLTKHPSNLDIENALNETEMLLQDSIIKDLVNIPEIRDLKAIASMRILISMSMATFLAIPRLFTLIVTQQVKLSVEYGNSPEACVAYAFYGELLCQILGKFDEGYEIGQLALSLLSKLQAKRLESQTSFIVILSTKHWKEPLEQLLQPLLLGYQKGLETGDIEYAFWNSQLYCAYLFSIGRELNEVQDELSKYLEAAKNLQSKNSLYFLEMNYQVVLNLKNESQFRCLLIGEKFNEEQMLPRYKKVNYRLALFQFYSHKTMLCYVLGEFRQALENSIEGEKYVGEMTTAGLPSFLFYNSLSHLAIPSETTHQQEKILKKVTDYQAKMKVWATHNPSHYLAKFYLVEAELSRVLNHDEEAREYYDRAISLFQKNDYIHEQAIAYEIAARFYLAKNQNHLAHYYLQDAHYAYQRWGAIAKVKDLEEKYPQFLQKDNLKPFKSTIKTTGKHLSSNLDLNSVLKASQVISGEIVLEKLLEKFMETVIENAGAQRGFLLLEKASNWVIEAAGDIDSNNLTVLQSIPMETIDSKTQAPILSVAIINYVAHTQENIVLNDATSEGQFTQTPYIIKTQPKSIICTPLLHQGKLTGIIYLENNLTTGAFTPERVEVLKILSTSAAISIENSRLYEQLEDYSKTLEKKVDLRTQELRDKNQQLANTLEQLKATQAQIIAQEKLASLGALTAGIAHEIKNPLNFVNNFAELCIELTEEVQEEIEAQKDKLEEETIEYLEEVLGDIKQNSQKIHAHGQRADKIVHGMLMHSRGKPGQRELTDVNSLLAESINLAYHGIRAKDTSFKLKIQTNYAENLPKITLSPQEISRVFLNTINNACYAVHEKKKARGEEFEPTLTITTREQNEQIEISIRDNGNGIPKTMLDQVFNPFFTTKPTGQGTGLGLSISHDIIVQGHRGQILVESEENNYTELKILLPKKQDE
ncbi:AAA family ATPase [Crocosphaera sp. XPORK-15E]|uniref:trifunctional serine/threonine-protein kinase/ATP-binding protein/sensor histidine kinase n=1 Tax=Crocosphaera sp. XPORK-15E TaxID=3110247 RepID=UPI002B2192CF|nr:AAA family ATPase [Crocosphaera sp. XPORK-15E]MEA5533919.1 AAA family ATPase [Crocosphaera sp. XPORK-15E]